MIETKDKAQENIEYRVTLLPRKQIDRLSGTVSEIKERIREAQAAFATFNKQCKTKEETLRRNLRICSSIQMSCQFCCMGARLERHHRLVQRESSFLVRKCRRKLLRIKYLDSVSNEEMWKRPG